jgi:hypothetical protein
MSHPTQNHCRLNPRPRRRCGTYREQINGETEEPNNRESGLRIKVYVLRSIFWLDPKPYNVSRTTFMAPIWPLWQIHVQRRVLPRRGNGCVRHACFLQTLCPHRGTVPLKGSSSSVISKNCFSLLHFFTSPLLPFLTFPV